MDPYADTAGSDKLPCMILISVQIYPDLPWLRLVTWKKSQAILTNHWIPWYQFQERSLFVFILKTLKTVNIREFSVYH